MGSKLTGSGWVVEKDVVDERLAIPRLTGAQIVDLHTRIAAGAREYPIGTMVIRSDDELVMQLQGVGNAARFVAPAAAPALAELTANVAGIAANATTALVRFDDNGTVDIYSPGDALGKAKVVARGRDTGGAAHFGVEGYTAHIESQPTGSGDGTVPGTDFAFGVSILKQNWQTTMVEGQVCGLNIVTRGGYHGTGGAVDWTPGDTAAIITNTVVSGLKSFAAILEGVAYYMPGGSYVAGSTGIRVQLGAQRHDQGLAIGALVIGETGSLGAAFQAQNSTTWPAGRSDWSHFLRYVYVPPTGPAYQPFAVDNLGAILMNGGGTLPVKSLFVRASDGAFCLNNNAGTAIAVFADNGDAYVGGKLTINGDTKWTAYSPALSAATGTFANATITASYKQIGKLTLFSVTASIVAIGTAAGALRFQLPVAAAAGPSPVFPGREGGVTGKMLQAFLETATTVLVYTYDNGSPIANGAQITVTGSYIAN